MFLNKIRNIFVSWGPFLKRPGNLTGPKSDFDIKVSRKVGRVLTSDEDDLVSLADNFTVQFSNLLKLPLEWKTKQLNGPGSLPGASRNGHLDTKFVSTTNVARAGKRGNICVGNNVSATMCPRLPVP